MHSCGKLMDLYAYPDVGRTGLCNMLFPWARAIIYARKMKCQMIAPMWTKVTRIGPWLRGERDKRYYFGQFTNSGYVKGGRRAFVIIRSKWQSYVEGDPAIYELKKGVVAFRGLGNYFSDISSDAILLRNELMKIVAPDIIAKLNDLPSKFIGVHLRCGDFVTTGQGLSHDYYLRGIEAARSMLGAQLPALVFSDGRPNELHFLSKCDGVRLMPVAPAIHDVLALSRASVLVGTNHSSFSEWGAFLGGMKSVWSKDGRKPDGFFDAVFV